MRYLQLSTAFMDMWSWYKSIDCKKNLKSELGIGPFVI